MSLEVGAGNLDDNIDEDIFQLVTFVTPVIGYSMASHSRPVIGKLKFKGEKKTKKKANPLTDEKDDLAIENRSGLTGHQTESEERDVGDELVGSGRITSSSTTIHGHFTKFMDELRCGDAIIITHQTSLQDEMKIVRMVLSNISISISSAFSTDLISTTSFRYIKGATDATAPPVDPKAPKAQNSEEAAFGTYASQGGEKFVYRVKKKGSFGGYKIISEDTGGVLSREELLEKRSKKKSDRFCY